MIRIGFITHGLNTGGIERSITRIASLLDRDHFQPVVICLGETGPAAGWLPDDVPVIEIRKRAGNDISATRRLATILRKQEIDLIQSHNWGTLIESVIARKLSRTPAHIHAERGTVLGRVDTGGGLKYRLRALAMRTALRTVSHVMSNAHAVAKRVEERCGYPVNQIEVIPNGVPEISVDNQHAIGRQLRTSLGLSSNATLLGTIGRLHPVKGFDTLLHAISHRFPEFQDMHLVIVGEGDQRVELEAIIKEKSLCDHVHLVGHQENTDEWMAGFDIYVNSSRSEGMSQSICEAMSAGLPIVATDVGDAKQMICREELPCGLVCPSEDARALAKSISGLLSDNELLACYGRNSVDCHRLHYSEKRFIECIEHLYFKTMDRRGSPLAQEKSLPNTTAKVEQSNSQEPETRFQITNRQREATKGT